MFEDCINVLENMRSEFSSQVKDTFGKSIDDNVFEPTKSELISMEAEYSFAETKMNEIRILTMELRTII